MDFETMEDYDLCALYCDYYEWLQSPTTSPDSPKTREEYEGYMRGILLELGRRYGESEEEE